jgi:hypothetical protein
VQRFPTKLHKRFYAPQVIRYADDLVVLHKDHAIIEQCQEVLAEWLQNMGLELKPSKTRITHTRYAPAGEAGFGNGACVMEVASQGSRAKMRRRKGEVRKGGGRLFAVARAAGLKQSRMQLQPY